MPRDPDPASVILKRPRVLWIGCALALAGLVSMAASTLFGAYPVPAGRVLTVLMSLAGLETQPVDPTLAAVVLDLRLSRIVLAFLVGAALASSGVVYQGLLQNPLADPFTLGVSGGAAFGASMAVMLGLTGIAAGAPAYGFLPLFSLLGALGALAAVIALGRMAGPLRRETLVLAGIVVATFLSALISLIKSLDEESVSAIVFWIMGSFQGRTWSHVRLFLPYFAIGMVVIARYSRELDLLALGDVQARQLGVETGRVRLMLLIGASLAAAGAVAVSGVIGFVGLVVPHVVRLVQGAEHRPLLVGSALLGGLLMVWSDVLARTLLSGGAELPVGVITALLGAPFFCLLLGRRRAGDAG